MEVGFLAQRCYFVIVYLSVSVLLETSDPRPATKQAGEEDSEVPDGLAPEASKKASLSTGNTLVCNVTDDESEHNNSKYKERSQDKSNDGSGDDVGPLFFEEREVMLTYQYKEMCQRRGHNRV